MVFPENETELSLEAMARSVQLSFEGKKRLHWKLVNNTASRRYEMGCCYCSPGGTRRVFTPNLARQVTPVALQLRPVVDIRDDWWQLRR